jgi:small subunit ribosomal protein S2
MMNTEWKALLAVTLLVLGLLQGMNVVIDEEPAMGAIIRTVLFLVGAALFYLWMRRDNRTVEEVAEETLDEVEKQLDVVKEAVQDAKEQAKERVEEALEYANLEPDEDDVPTREIVEVPPADIVPVSEMPTELIPAEDVPAPVVPVPAAAGEPDDLTIIEGIGPAYRDLLVNSGIATFAKLATMTEDEIVTLIRENGGRKSTSMATWAAQAKLAAAGDWEGLQKLKSTLSGGRK